MTTIGLSGCAIESSSFPLLSTKAWRTSVTSMSDLRPLTNPGEVIESRGSVLFGYRDVTIEVSKALRRLEMVCGAAHC